ncbi:MAG: hypothetical protein J5I91_08035 [Bacteroidetes bacterium]|nr:hypothetical protein [Bacteroidota bacterium]
MTEETNKQSNSKNKIVIILLIILLLGSGGLSYWQFSEYKKLEKQLTETQDNLKTTLTAKDSLELNLNELEKKLVSIESERAELADYAGTLETDVENLKKTIANLRARLAKASPEEIARLKKEVEAATIKANDYQAEIEKLKAENEELRKKGEELTEQNVTLSNINQTLDAKVQKASAAQYAPIKLTLGRMKRKGFKEETKVRKVEEIHVDINVIENPIVNSPSDQVIIIRIIDPDKTVLSKVENNKTLVNKSDVYTIKNTFSFDGKAKNINLVYTPEAKLKKGAYKVEFWANGELKQTGSFELE